MVAFLGDKESGFGPGGDRMEFRSGRGDGWPRVVACGIATLGVAAGGGCGCETDFRLLQGEVESCFEAEWRCCQRITEQDPASGTECFDELRQRRRRLSEMLFEWLEACRDSEHDVARDLGRAIRGVLLAGPCEGGPVRTLADGRTVTAGLPFGETDAISLRWEPAAAARDGRREATLSGRAVAVRIGGRDLQAFASGRLAIRIDRAASAGPSIEAFELDLAASIAPDGGPERPRARLRLVRDGRFPARSFVRDGAERLGFLVEVSGGRDSWPLPPRIWMEWPVSRAGEAITVGGDAMPMWELMPPDPGIADWNGDGNVDPVDLAEFLATPPHRRDLDLDGEDTPKDLDRFLESWSVRCERPSR